MKEIVLKHPLIENKISIIRNEKTGTKEFREIITELSMIVCYEAMRDATLHEVDIKTPITNTKGYKIDEKDYIFMPILRAGLSMVDGVIKMIPNAKIGHIGLYRNEETLEPVKYYFKMKKNGGDPLVLLLDPMLATGGSACAAIDMIKKEGIKKIKFLSIISAPEGIERVKKEHPDVQIYTTQVDLKLNDIGYIVPGLGDAGDRIFGTQ